VNFGETYAGMSDDELLTIAAKPADLVHEASLALKSEMARRGLSHKDALAKKRQVARLEIKEARRNQSSSKRSKYFVARLNGWALLLLILGVPALALTLTFSHIVSEEWVFPIMAVCMGVVIAISAVQTWLRKTASFWISLVVSCAVQLSIGYSVSLRFAPQTSRDLKGAALLTIVPGYAIGILLFSLLEKIKRSATQAAAAEISTPAPAHAKRNS